MLPPRDQAVLGSRGRKSQRSLSDGYADASAIALCIGLQGSLDVCQRVLEAPDINQEYTIWDGKLVRHDALSTPSIFLVEARSAFVFNCTCKPGTPTATGSHPFSGRPPRVLRPAPCRAPRRRRKADRARRP